MRSCKLALTFSLLLVAAKAQAYLSTYNPFTGKPDYYGSTTTVTSASALIVATGTVTYIQPFSTATTVIIFSSNTMKGSFLNGTTVFIGLNASSVTLSGNMFVTTNTWTNPQNWTNPTLSTFTYGVSVGTITTHGSGNIISTNGNTVSVSSMGVLYVYNNNSAPGRLLLSVGSNQQADQFSINDSQQVNFSNFGIRAGDLFLGRASNTHKIESDQDNGQFIFMWNSGYLDIQNTTLASGGKDIRIFPGKAEAMRFANGGAVTIVSTTTFTNVVNISTVTWSAFTFATLGTGPDGTQHFCSDCTKATPCAGSGTGAFAKRLNSAWDCN